MEKLKYKSMNENDKNHLDVWKVVIDLWKGENAVKTSKLMMFFAVQTLFVIAFDINKDLNWVVPLLAVLFSLFWYFCIGRTVVFQKYWKKKANEYYNNFTDEMKAVYDIFPKPDDKYSFPFYGKMPAKFILLGPPIMTFIIWLIILVFALTLEYAKH